MDNYEHLQIELSSSKTFIKLQLSKKKILS